MTTEIPVYTKRSQYGQTQRIAKKLQRPTRTSGGYILEKLFDVHGPYRFRNSQREGEIYSRPYL